MKVSSTRSLLSFIEISFVCDRVQRYDFFPMRNKKVNIRLRGGVFAKHFEMVFFSGVKLFNLLKIN